MKYLSTVYFETFSKILTKVRSSVIVFNNMDSALLRTVKDAGLNEKEAMLYLALLSLGSGNAAQIAKGAEINRSTAYLLLEDLVRRGFVTHVPNRKVKRYMPVEPIRLVQVARERAENLKFMLPLLQSVFVGGTDKPRVEIHEGKEAVKNVFSSFGLGKEAFYVSSFSHLRGLFGDKIDNWSKSAQSGKTKTKIRQLLSHDKESERFHEAVSGTDQWEIRFLPEDFSIEMDLAIVDDVIGITHFDPLYTVVVRSKPMADSLLRLFELIWLQAK
tara:strand:+ start:121 stop:939 length:819 start_codon:yes stop_codon:yes gene_type:complete